MFSIGNVFRQWSNYSSKVKTTSLVFLIFLSLSHHVFMETSKIQEHLWSIKFDFPITTHIHSCPRVRWFTWGQRKQKVNRADSLPLCNPILRRKRLIVKELISLKKHFPLTLTWGRYKAACDREQVPKDSDRERAISLEELTRGTWPFKSIFYLYVSYERQGRRT